MPSESGRELKKAIEDRKVQYLVCVAFFDVPEMSAEEKLRQGAKIPEKSLLFITSFPSEYYERYIKNANGKHTVIIILDASLLYEEDSLRTYYDCYFEDAPSRGVTTRHNESSFLSLFREKILIPFTSDEPGRYLCLFRAKDMPVNKPTHPGACIVWDDDIDSKYIVGFSDTQLLSLFGPTIDEKYFDCVDDFYEDLEKEQEELYEEWPDGDEDEDNHRRDDFNYPYAGYSQEELDKLLEEAAERDMQFGTHEYGELFNDIYGSLPEGNPNYEDEEDSDKNDDDPDFDWLLNYMLVDYATDWGYLEDIDDKIDYFRPK